MIKKWFSRILSSEFHKHWQDHSPASAFHQNHLPKSRNEVYAIYQTFKHFLKLKLCTDFPFFYNFQMVLLRSCSIIFNSLFSLQLCRHAFIHGFHPWLFLFCGKRIFFTNSYEVSVLPPNMKGWWLVMQSHQLKKRDSFIKSFCKVTWEMKNDISPLPQDLSTPNFENWCKNLVKIVLSNS